MASIHENAEAVRAAVSSASTCTPSTATILSELLLPKANGTETKALTKTAPIAKSKTAKSAPAKARGRKVVEHENINQHIETLSPKERSILATEVINATLKALGEAIKTPQRVRKQPSTRDLTKTSARRALRRSISVPQSPLTPRSLNRVASSPNLATRFSRSPSVTSTASSGPRACGECARVAFSCLRTLQASKTAGVDLAALQLENGMSALVAKLIGLGLDDLAIKEIRVLKRRLEPESQISTKKNTSKPPTLAISAPSYSELLDFGDQIEPSKLSLIIVTQLQVLRLMTSSRKSKQIEAALRILEPSHPSSPTKLLLLASKKTNQNGKIARQLQSLSELTLSLSPSISSSEDAVALESRLSISPEIAFQMQALALQNRIMWWRLSGHKGDPTKEVLDPFLRCLSAFSRRSQAPALQNYKLALQVFERLQAAILTFQNQPEKTGKVTGGIYKLLGSLSQDAKLLDEALLWTEKVHTHLDIKTESETRRCAVVARMASLSLQTSTNSSKTEELLLKLLDELERPFKGDQSEIEDLLAEISIVRRSAISILSKRGGIHGGSGMVTAADGIRQMCESLVFLCPRLFLRYLGKAPDSMSGTKEVLRHEQRRLFITKPGTNAIDSALYLIKVHLNEGRLTWDLLDSMLQDCLSLLEHLNNSTREIFKKDDVPSVSYHVKISNLYFSQYLTMRRDAQNAKDFQYLRPLRRSVDSVRSRPPLERQAAMLPSKLERLAEIFRITGRYDELFKTLLALRDEMIDYRVLSLIASAAATQPLCQAWSMDENALILARTTSSLIKVVLKYGFSASDMPLIEESWSPEEKGTLLEQQLETISRHCTNSHTAVALRNKIFRLLVTIYDEKQYPIRRIRVLVAFLSLELAHRQEVTDGEKDLFCFNEIEEIDLIGTKDEGLRGFLSSLQATAASLVELHQDEPRIAILKRSIGVWLLDLGGCKSLDELEAKVEDSAGILSHLQFIADFLDMKGSGETRIAILRLMANIMELRDNASSPDGIVRCYADLGMQWVRLGYSGKAGLVLDRAQLYSTNNGVTSQALLHFSLTYSEYLLAIGNMDKCEEQLLRAQATASHDETLATTTRQTNCFSSSTRTKTLVANAFLVYSKLALQRGAHDTALAYAKQSVRLLRRAWNKAEQKIKRKENEAEDVDTSEIEKLTEDTSTLTLSQNSLTTKLQTHQNLAATDFWNLIRPLFESISHLSEVYSQNGLFQETLYYAEQAQKLVQEVGSETYLAVGSAMLGGTWLRAGRLDKSSELLAQSRELSKSYGHNINTITMACYLGEMHGRLGDHAQELQVYQDAERALKTLAEPEFINNIGQTVEHVDTLEAKMSLLAISMPKAKGTRKVTARSKVVVNRKTSTRTKVPVVERPPIAEECTQLASLEATILRQKASALMLNKNCDEAFVLLQESNKHKTNQMDVINQNIVMAKYLLHQSLEQMNADPVYSVLQDSTISFPSVVSQTKNDKANADKVSAVRSSPPSKRLNVSVAMLDRSRSKSPAPDSFFDKLRQAQQLLIEVQSTAALIAPVSVLHTLAALLNSIAVLLSAAGPIKGKSLSHPGLASCFVETTRNLALCRERKALLADQQSSLGTHEMSWPVIKNSDSRRASISTPQDITRLQRDYIDLIPEAWTTISIALSDSHQELSITKLQAGHSPFVLRLPLGRNNSIDADEEVFGFEQGHSELMEIIELANESAHNAGNMTGRQAKAAWWEVREGLDARLKDLLDNIEKVWLGGFKGIFSQAARRPDLLARFQKSFQNTLDKYLPSRQKVGRKVKGPRVTLDTRILDLFIGLGDASVEDIDLDEPLNDLLYFVVDILQFHGELNAYAEIDFDSIVIEIHDALRCYHEAVHTSMDNGDNRHTILVLDKALHAFPWESLPCMEGLAVSRLPSLASLRDRILELQKDSPEDGPDGQYISRGHGAYILNPGGDLKSTQATFQKDLQGLDGWDGVVKREPTEAEIKSSLETKDLFLYFGHGSGAQYIRAREIRKMDKCAVTMLMGCSSGALVEAGEFEPYGPPINYMHAGCPALVATLWDVTDKDIDRFAKSTFEHWGLFDSGSPVAKGRGRKRVEMVHPKKSLVEAVARGKEACNLRYLNGAAVCVYGVPVYFK